MTRTAPHARPLSRLLTMERERLSQSDAVTVAAVETGLPALVAACVLLERFHRMLRTRDVDALGPWLADAGGSLLASFGRGIATDLAAAKVALIKPWSNGQTEGQITKLKPVKRQGYGHAGIDLLRARLVVAP